MKVTRINKTLRLVFIIFIALIAIGIASVRFYQRNLMTVSGENMMPTLAPLEVIEVDRTAFGSRGPEPGEIVLYLAKMSEPTPRIGRVVGVPGDRLAFVKGKLFVNDQPVQTGVELAQNNNLRIEQVSERLGQHEYKSWYVVAYEGAPDSTAQMGDGEYFILGDHRSNSQDSRFLGKIPMANIVGSVLRIHDSHDQSRVGKELYFKK